MRDKKIKSPNLGSGQRDTSKLNCYATTCDFFDPFIEGETKASPSFLVKCELEGGLQGSTDGKVFNKYTDFYFFPE